MQEQEQGQGESSPFIRAFIRMIRGEKPAEKVAGDVTPEAPKAPPLPEWAIAEIAKSGKDGFTQVAHGSDVLRVVQGKVTYNGREYVEMGDEWIAGAESEQIQFYELPQVVQDEIQEAIREKITTQTMAVDRHVNYDIQVNYNGEAHVNGRKVAGIPKQKP